MAKRFALLCPGQGAQHPAMFDLARSHAPTAQWLTTVLASFDQGDGAVKSLAQILAEPQAMYANRYAQGLIVAASLANWHALQAVLPTPSLVAGYSIGEVSAHAVAGRLSLNNAIDLANARAIAMQACVDPAKPQSMLALHLTAGATVSSIAPLLAASGLFIAIVNASNRCLIAGLASDIERALPQLQTLAHCTPVAVHIASHTPLMSAAQNQFKIALQQVHWLTPTCPVLAGVDGHYVSTVSDTEASLLAQLVQTLQWDACIDQCAEAGIEYALELGPGNALSSMVRERHPQITCRSVHDFRSIDGIARWLQQLA